MQPENRTGEKSVMDTQAVVAAINAMATTLSSRIESTEQDVAAHMKKMEDRLDLLVDLTKTVAVLQAQTSQTADQMQDIRSQIRETAGKTDGLINVLQHKTDTSINRLHARVDELGTSLRDRIELAQKDAVIDLKTVTAKHDSLSQKVDGWINWGKGAYAVGAVFVAFMTWIGGRWLDDLEKRTQSISILKQDINALDMRTIELNNKITTHVEQDRK